MQSVAEISFDVIQRFEPTSNDVKELIHKLSVTYLNTEKKKVNKVDEDSDEYWRDHWYQRLKPMFRKIEN